MRYAAVSVVLVMACVVPVVAGDGATPIWGQTHITEPGHYVVTRDITHSAYIIFIENSASDVVLDLNGFTLTTQTSSAISSHASENVTIRNGTLRPSAGGVGVECMSDNCVIENVRTIGGIYGISMAGGATPIVRDSTVIGAQEGIRVAPPVAEAGYGGLLENNTIVRSLSRGIYVAGSAGLRIINNQIHETGSGGTSAFGIYADCDHCLIKDNHITQTGGTAVYVNDYWSRVEGNHITDSTRWGLHFGPGSGECLYRANTVQYGNGSGCTGPSSGGVFCDEAPQVAPWMNMSHGDNYMPGPGPGPM